jgi:hypothetical protein
LNHTVNEIKTHSGKPHDEKRKKTAAGSENREMPTRQSELRKKDLARRRGERMTVVWRLEKRGFGKDEQWSRKNDRIGIGTCVYFTSGSFIFYLKVDNYSHHSHITKTFSLDIYAL